MSEDRVMAAPRTMMTRLDDAAGRARASLVTAVTPGIHSEGHWVLGPRSHVRLSGDGELSIGERVVFRGDAEISVQGRCVIGDDTFVNRWFYLSAMVDVAIGALVRCGERVSIHDENHLAGADDYHVAPVAIGDRVWLGADVIVLSGVTIGEGAIVAAGAVVRDHVPPWTVVAGVPARVVRRAAS